MTRLATAVILLDAPNAAPTGTPSLPIIREVREIPTWLAGDTRPAELRPGFVGPPRPRPIALKASPIPACSSREGVSTWPWNSIPPTHRRAATGSKPTRRPLA